MDKENIVRTVLAVAISLVIMLVWQAYFAPKPPPRAPEPEQAAAETAGQPGDQSSPGLEPLTPVDSGLTGPVPSPAATTLGALATGETPTAERIEGDEGQENLTIATRAREIVLSPRGARLIHYRLLDHLQVPGAENPRPLDLVSPVARALQHEPLFLVTGDEVLDATINQAWYLVDQDLPSPEENSRLGLSPGTERVNFLWADGFGLEVRKTLFFHPDEDYLLKVDWQITRGGVPLETAMLSWGPGISRVNEEAKGNRYAYWGHVIAALPGDLTQYEASDVTGKITWPAGGAPRWLSLDSQYFSLAMIAGPNSSAAVRAFDTTPIGEAAATQKLAIESAARTIVFFGGPKTDELLAQVDSKLQTDLGLLIDWGFFGVVARPMYLALKWIHSYLGNWGWAIVLITFVIKVIFYPITQKSMVSMRLTQQKMSKLQPKIKHIKEKYRDKRDMDSRKAMNEETMALYNREGVNPMSSLSGCMPLLLQLPILWAMYQVLSKVTALRGAPFIWWIGDLSAPDPLWIPVLPVVMGATMLIQQLISMTKTEDPQQKSQQRMMLFMPIMFTYFFLSLPAGLVLYWLTNNVLGIGQQVLINRTAAKLGLTPVAKKSK